MVSTNVSMVLYNYQFESKLIARLWDNTFEEILPIHFVFENVLTIHSLLYFVNYTVHDDNILFDTIRSDIFLTKNIFDYGDYPI